MKTPDTPKVEILPTSRETASETLRRLARYLDQEELRSVDAGIRILAVQFARAAYRRLRLRGVVWTEDRWVRAINCNYEPIDAEAAQ